MKERKMPDDSVIHPELENKNTPFINQSENSIHI
jgi:hypothetical protein